MAGQLENARSTTGTRTRLTDVSPISGMCAICVRECNVLCEVSKSAFRGREVLYPNPEDFGKSTAASNKDYLLDWSHFQIMVDALGAHGVPPDPDAAIFPAADVSTVAGGVPLRVPAFIAGLGSTRVAADHWAGLACGAALAGTMQVIGENVCGMDEQAEFRHGRVVHSPEMERRVKLYKSWQDGYGTIVVQANVEDTRLGVHEYVISKLEVEAVELKWGQGAKDIGGEVKIKDLAKARMLKQRGYIVLPDPDDPQVVQAFERGSFKEFERHSRVGMPTLEDFVKRVDELRRAGARYVFLKTGAYRPADLARALKFSSVAGIDLLTVDGAGGGTGMSPWRMMNEWGVPPVELHSLLYRYVKRLAERGAYIPDIAIAGGFAFEDQIFKGLALGAPYFKVIGMARAPLAAAMVGKTLGRRIEDGDIPVYVARFGDTIEEIFVTAPELKRRFGTDFQKIPPGAIGLYTYLQRLAQGLRQLMCGNRKFALDYISRDDIAALTREAAQVSGIPYIMEADLEIVQRILEE